MESTYQNLTLRALKVHDRTQSSGVERTLIILAGPPGSGKTTIAKEVIRRINKIKASSMGIVLPMDGFHLYRRELDELPNKEEAYERRGAAWTFDSSGVLKLVKNINESKRDKSETILAPSFDHVDKDPIQDAIKIGPEVSLIVMEGNWLLYDQEPWSKIAMYADDTWFVDVHPDLARDRVARRHITSGLEADWRAAVKRVEGNDLLNGIEIQQKLIPPKLIIKSVES